MKKRFLKKQVNKNFIFSLTLVAMLLFVVLLGVYIINSSVFKEEAFFYLFFGLGFISWIIICAVMILLPAIWAFYIFIFAFIARLIYKETPGRIRAYRILMGFSFSGQILLLLTVFSGVGSGGWLSLIDLAISGYIFFAIFQGIRGTYTDRIKVGTEVHTKAEGQIEVNEKVEVDEKEENINI